MKEIARVPQIRVRPIREARAEIRCEAQRIQIHHAAQKIRCESREHRDRRIRLLELKSLHAIRRSRRANRRNLRVIHPAVQTLHSRTRRPSPQPQRDASYTKFYACFGKLGGVAESHIRYLVYCPKVIQKIDI